MISSINHGYSSKYSTAVNRNLFFPKSSWRPGNFKQTASNGLKSTISYVRNWEKTIQMIANPTREMDGIHLWFQVQPDAQNIFFPPRIGFSKLLVSELWILNFAKQITK